MPISIVFLTTGLGVGGAETMLYKLLTCLDRTKFIPQVVSLVDRGPMSEKIRMLGVPLRSLGMRPGRPHPLPVLRLARWLRQVRPNIMQTWMYHADLVGGLAAKLTGNLQVVWGIRQSDLNPVGNKRLTFYTVRACARMSRWLPARIVCCSQASKKVHTALGYAREKMIVIPNGSDLSAFKPDQAARESMRRELGISDEALIIGLVARFHPQKDHRNFIQAAGLLHRHRADVHFVMCGKEVSWDNAQLTHWIQSAGIREHCHLLGERYDMPRLTAAFDVASTSALYGEGFPNVIVEAMSCGIPCVVTDVGDSAFIMDGTGRVVPPADPAALASAWRQLLGLGREERDQLGLAARQRVKQHFDLPDIVSRYETLYQELVG
jgi:glycosyltransferase involved in cell wall biosynthesis